MKDFSVDSFKKWLKDQNYKEFSYNSPLKNTNIGNTVESKISVKKLVNMIEAEEGDRVDLAIDFKENNGTIKENNGDHYLIEVESGTFYIHKGYVRELFS